MKGAIYKRRMLDTSKVQGLGYFGALAASYLYFPAVVGILGHNLTIFGMVASGILGMQKFDDKTFINSIEWVREGEQNGFLRFTVSKGLVGSASYIVNPYNVHKVSEFTGDSGDNYSTINLYDFVDESGKTVA